MIWETLFRAASVVGLLCGVVWLILSVYLKDHNGIHEAMTFTILISVLSIWNKMR